MIITVCLSACNVNLMRNFKINNLHGGFEMLSAPAEIYVDIQRTLPTENTRSTIFRNEALSSPVKFHHRFEGI
jgi:hypothetical protein